MHIIFLNIGTNLKSEESFALKRARKHPFFYTPLDRAQTRKVSYARPIDGNWVEASQIGRILDATTIKNI
jgi:hypothetical protein